MTGMFLVKRHIIIHPQNAFKANYTGCFKNVLLGYDYIVIFEMEQKLVFSVKMRCAHAS